MSNQKYLGESVIMCLQGERVLVYLNEYDAVRDALNGVAFPGGTIRVKSLKGSTRWTGGKDEVEIALALPVLTVRPYPSTGESNPAFRFLPKDASEEEYAELADYVRGMEHGQPSDRRDVNMGDGGEKPSVGGGRVDDTPTAEIPDAPTTHPADTNKDNVISKSEAKEWNAEHPDEPVKRG